MLSDFQLQIEYEFRDQAFLQMAFVHRSYLNEHKSVTEHNERLEFLGDAVLELVATEFLYTRYPDQPEGELTTWRSALVKGEQLADLGRELGLGDLLKLSRGEAKSGGRSKGYLLANCFEALVGAIYLDGGLDPARVFLTKFLLPRLDQILATGSHVDAKSRLQELAQERQSVTPEYKIVGESGPDHAKSFVMSVCFGQESIAEGCGASKQAAEQDAARVALEKLGWS